MKKYRNKYKGQTTRVSWWDYGSNGFYFITINTGNRKHFFGHIHSGIMNYSEIGEIARDCW